MGRFATKLALLVIGLCMLAGPAMADMVAPDDPYVTGLRAEKEEAVPSIRPDDGNSIEPQPPKRRAPKECIRGGCSGELCVDAESGGMASACVWRPEFQCYASFGKCERQPDGNCGWTQSDALKGCINERRMGGER